MPTSGLAPDQMEHPPDDPWGCGVLPQTFASSQASYSSFSSADVYRRIKNFCFHFN